MRQIFIRIEDTTSIQKFGIEKVFDLEEFRSIDTLELDPLTQEIEKLNAELNEYIRESIISRSVS